MKPRSMELMLAGWHKDHSAGTKVTFWINDEDLEYFESMTCKKGKVAGQRLAAALVEIGDDEQPVPHETPKRTSTSKFPGGLTGLSVMWVEDPHFREWLRMNRTEYVPTHLDLTDSRAAARAAVFAICGIASRTELNDNKEAAELFRQRIMVPYAAARKADGLDD